MSPRDWTLPLLSRVSEWRFRVQYHKRVGVPRCFQGYFRCLTSGARPPARQYTERPSLESYQLCMALMIRREKTRCTSHYHTQVYPVPAAGQGSLWDAACLTQGYAGSELAGLSACSRFSLSAPETCEQNLLTIESTSCEVKSRRTGLAGGLLNSVTMSRQKSAIVVCRTPSEKQPEVGEVAVIYAGKSGSPVSIGCVWGEPQETGDGAEPSFGCTYDCDESAGCSRRLTASEMSSCLWVSSARYARELSKVRVAEAFSSGE
jgi:hypothetical protein